MEGVVERGGRQAFKGLVTRFCIFIARHYLFSQELLRARGEIFVASDRQFLVQPLALRTQAVASQSPRVASAGLAFKAFRRRCAKRERCHGRHAPAGEQPRRRRLRIGLPAPTAFRRARARSCHTQLTLGACRPHWREVVLSSSCASERVRRSPQCGGSRDCQAPSQWRRALPCWANVTVHRLASHARCSTTASIGRGTCCNAGPGRTVGCCIWYACHLAV